MTPRISFDPPLPCAGCPGGYRLNGLPVPLCITCSRLGGKDIEPAVRVQLGHAECVNFLPLADGQVNPAPLSSAQVAAMDEMAGLHPNTVPSTPEPVHPAERGGCGQTQHSFGGTE